MKRKKNSQEIKRNLNNFFLEYKIVFFFEFIDSFDFIFAYDKNDHTEQILQKQFLLPLLLSLCI